MRFEFAGPTGPTTAANRQPRLYLNNLINVDCPGNATKNIEYSQCTCAHFKPQLGKCDVKMSNHRAISLEWDPKLFCFVFFYTWNLILDGFSSLVIKNEGKMYTSELNMYVFGCCSLQCSFSVQPGYGTFNLLVRKAHSNGINRVITIIIIISVFWY